MFENSSLCVVGNINRDVKLLGVPDSPALFRDGETSVPTIVETVGGGGANSACSAAALGMRTARLLPHFTTRDLAIPRPRRYIVYTVSGCDVNARALGFPFHVRSLAPLEKTRGVGMTAITVSSSAPA